MFKTRTSRDWANGRSYTTAKRFSQAAFHAIFPTIGRLRNATRQPERAGVRGCRCGVPDRRSSGSGGRGGRLRTASSAKSRPADRPTSRRSDRRRGTSTFRSLCRRLISAVMSSWQGAARTPGNLVGHDAHAHAGPADQNAAIDLAAADLAGDRGGDVRIVDFLAIVGSQRRPPLGRVVEGTRSTSPATPRLDGRFRRQFASFSPKARVRHSRPGAIIVAVVRRTQSAALRGGA